MHARGLEIGYVGQKCREVWESLSLAGCVFRPNVVIDWAVFGGD